MVWTGYHHALLQEPGAGEEINEGRARGGVYMYGVWTGSVKDSVRDGQRREQAAGICVAACVHAVCQVRKDLSQRLAVLNFHE